MFKGTIFFIAVFISLLILTSKSHACVAPPPPSLCEILPDSICKVLVEVKDDRPLPGGSFYEVTVSSFVTFGGQEGESCAVALADFSIGKLVAADVYYLDDKKVKGFNFKPNELAAKSIKLAGLPSKVKHFDTAVAGILKSDVPRSKWVKLKLGIETTRKLPAKQIESALRDAIFATGSSNSKGEYTGEHLEVMRLEMKHPDKTKH